MHRSKRVDHETQAQGTPLETNELAPGPVAHGRGQITLPHPIEQRYRAIDGSQHGEALSFEVFRVPHRRRFSMCSTEANRDRLLFIIEDLGRCAVAFSGGVDSAVVAKAAQVALGKSALAVTAVSASLAAGELATARAVVTEIGIRHEILETEELENLDYTTNSPQRCYHCKSELYAKMHQKMEQWGVAFLLNGANLDDQGDYRPGLKAAAEWKVRSPLIECGMDKAAVRRLARHWNLPVWDKPATPCLSSRVAYGEQITPQRLAMIDQAEQFLKEAGYGTVRVRYHGGDLARVEVPLDRVAELSTEFNREQIIAELRKIGFRYVCLDLEGFRSGSQNLVLASVEPQ